MIKSGKALGAVMAAVLLCASTVMARDVSGTFEVSGDSTLSFGKDTTKTGGVETSKETSFDGAISVIRYITNLGGGLVVGYSKKKDTVNDSSMDVLMFGPILKVNVELSEKVNLFASGIVSIAKSKAETAGSSISMDGTFYGADAGVAMFPYPQFSVDLGARYSRMNLEANNKTSKSTGVESFVGISVYF